jgi:hypothetical protein
MLQTSLLSSTFLLFVVAANSVHAAERPTLNHTCDPRPDILAHPIYDAHTEYRRAYNRPRDIPGWIAHKIAPESLEAMVWCENVQAGNYQQKNMPPMCKSYYYPKPWEAMLTGARPDFPKPTQATSRRTPATQPDSMQDATEEKSEDNQKAETQEKSDAKQPSPLPPVPVPPNAIR